MKLFCYKIMLSVFALLVILPTQLLVYLILGFMEWCKSLSIFWNEK